MKYHINKHFNKGDFIVGLQREYLYNIYGSKLRTIYFINNCYNIKNKYIQQFKINYNNYKKLCRKTNVNYNNRNYTW